MDMVRCLLKKKNMPAIFWAEAVACAVYLINRSPTKILENSTPNEQWFGKKPTVSHFKTFGCLAYAQIPDSLRTKLDDKSEKCVFIGYSERSKAYKLYNPTTKKIVISRDVWFDEKACYDFSNFSDTSYSQILDFGESEDGGNDSPQNSPSPLARRTRSLREIYEATEAMAVGDHVYFAFFANEDRTSLEEASKEENKVDATKEEIKLIEENCVWEQTDLPPNKYPIGVNWVFKTKTHLDGSVNKFKMCLVAKGYNKKEGDDF